MFVTEGQEVSEGDPLLQYDMTNIDLAIEMKKLDIQTIENNSAVAQKELEKLKNTKPISNATTSAPSTDSVAPPAPETPSTDTSVTTPDTVEEKNGDAYNYISTTAAAIYRRWKPGESIPLLMYKGSICLWKLSEYIEK